MWDQFLIIAYLFTLLKKQKNKSTDALFAKIVFYNQNLYLCGKHLQKMAGCNKYMT